MVGLPIPLGINPELIITKNILKSELQDRGDNVAHNCSTGDLGTSADRDLLNSSQLVMFEIGRFIEAAGNVAQHYIMLSRCLVIPSKTDEWWWMSYHNGLARGLGKNIFVDVMQYWPTHWAAYMNVGNDLYAELPSSGTALQLRIYKLA